MENLKKIVCVVLLGLGVVILTADADDMSVFLISKLVAVIMVAVSILLIKVWGLFSDLDQD